MAPNTDNEDGDVFRLRDGVRDTNEYAKFVCALAWNLIDVRDIQNRNKVFNWVQCMENEDLPSRIWYQLKSWFILRRIEFTKKQQQKLLSCLENVQDEELDENYDPDEPWRCAGENCDNPPGPKLFTYLCPNCCHEYAGMASSRDW